MRSERAAVWRLIVLVIVAVGLVSACGGATPEPATPVQQVDPTAEPVEPTDEPAEPPTQVPTEAPTEAPTEPPTEEPTEVPTEEPTEASTEEPTEASTEEPTEESAGIDAEALLQERCTVCHTLDRVMRAGHSALGWEQTVDRMVKRGAELNDEEQTILIDYLTETYGQ